MKRLSCITLLGASLLMFSCQDDAPTADENAIPDKFSEKTVAENKAELEDNGIQLIQSLEGLKDAQAADAATSLAGLLDSFDEEESVPGGRIISSVAEAGKDPKLATKIFSAMRLKDEVPSDEPESPSHFFEVYSGTYNYNASTEDWDFVAGGNAVIFNFPAVEGGSSNNATLTIGDYQGVEVVIDDYTEDVPTSLAMKLQVDGTKVLDYSFKASYNNSSDPVSLETSLTIDTYVFKVDFSNTTSEVSVNYSLKNGSETLIAAGGSSTGRYTVDGVVESEDEEVDTEDVIESASAYFQVYNIKIAGNVDVKSIAAGLDEIYKNENDTSFNYDQATVEEAELYNEHYNLVVFYVDSNEKIADTEFYAYTETDSYSYYEDRNGDGVDEEYTYTYTDTDLDIRFMFGDESPVDFETYFETGFSDIEAEFDSFYEAFEE